MKKFSVSKACNMCGECCLQTDMLVEDVTGRAVPVPDKYIRDLATAGQIIKLCPVGAISIIETPDIVLKKDQLISRLEEQLRAVVIPNVSNGDITYNEKDYSVSHGYINGENRAEYSSSRQAKKAGCEQFNQTFWSRRKDFAIDFLMQYKSRVLRKFYDFSDPSKTYYAQYESRIEYILKEVKSELSSISGSDYILPNDFTIFHPSEDKQFQKLVNDMLVKDTLDFFGSASYLNSFFDGFEKGKYQSLHDYEDRIYSFDHVDIVGTDWLGYNKIKTTYSFKGANECGRGLINDIGFYLRCPGSFGLRCVDEAVEDKLKLILERYRSLWDKVIQEKIMVYQETVDKLSPSKPSPDYSGTSASFESIRS